MPNYVRNIIHFTGDKSEIQNMLKSIQDDEKGIGSIDFNKLIPMPESLEIECGSRTDKGIKMVKEFLQPIQQIGTPTVSTPNELEALLSAHTAEVPEQEKAEWELGVKAAMNVLNYEHATWYDWSIANWGTKWNANCFDEGEDGGEVDTIAFDTAWSAPHPVIEKLAELYPNIEMEHKWADEDLGNNCGESTYANGERTSIVYPANNKSSLEFAADVWGYELADLSLYLNHAGDDYISADSENFDLVDMFEKPALFTNAHLTEKDIPQCLYFYHFRTDDDGCNQFASLEKSVLVNNGGTLITKEPIDLGANGCIELNEDTSPNFLGDEMTLDEYINSDFSMGEQNTKMLPM